MADEFPTRRPGPRSGRRPRRHSSGPSMSGGRKRTLDADGASYVRLVVEVTPKTREAIQLAQRLDETSGSVRDFILEEVIPKTNRILMRAGHGDMVIDFKSTR